MHFVKLCLSMQTIPQRHLNIARHWLAKHINGSIIFRSYLHRYYKYKQLNKPMNILFYDVCATLNSLANLNIRA